MYILKDLCEKLSTKRYEKPSFCQFTYPILKLWDYTDRIRSGELREFAPLLIMLERLVERRGTDTLNSVLSLIGLKPSEGFA